ncbi:hypothetical protein [Ferruginibacter sp. SUN106]|uniref:hypothetical protein n=1 Tax=Ferruginibacter sp. SUN106 TaxID=2978348 RepID=UPI003D35CD9E
MKFYLVSVLLVISNLIFGQTSTLLVSDDNLYRISLPNDWTKRTELGAGVQFSLTAPQQGDKQFAPSFQLETGTLQNGYQNASIDEISRKELEVTKQQGGEKLVIVRDSFKIINNKKWWNGIFHIQVTKKLAMDYFILKTIHNKITYTLNFSAPSDYFSKNLDQMYAYMETMMFYKTDATVYNNTTDNKSFDTELKKFEGIYFQQHPGASTKIIVGEIGNGIYGAKEVREIVKDGKTFVFEALLKPENIAGNTITLNSDEVVKADLPIIWSKATYELKKSGNTLQGTFFSNSNSFKGYEVVLENQQQPVAKNKTVSIETKTSPVNKKPAAVKTFKELSDTNGEQDNLINFGNGMVTRNGDNLTFQLKSGNTKVLKNNNNNNTVDYTFIGYSDELNSFIVENKGFESSDFSFINRDNGVTITVPGFDYEVSPSKNNVVFYNNGGLIDQTDESGIYIFSISKDGMQATFKKITFDVSKNTGWAPASVKWVNDNLIEVDKQVKASSTKVKAGGKCWLVAQTGGWTISNVLPKQNPGVTVVPTATDLEYGTQNSTPGATLVPSVTDRNYTGGKTMDELGRKLLNALITNDFKSWYSCVYESPSDEVKKDFDKLREGLQQDGVSTWNLAKFSRVTYTDFTYGKKLPEFAYNNFRIEFDYKSSFTGRFQCSSGATILIKGKYLLYRTSNFWHDLKKN